MAVFVSFKYGFFNFILKVKLSANKKPRSGEPGVYISYLG